MTLLELHTNLNDVWKKIEICDKMIAAGYKVEEVNEQRDIQLTFYAVGIIDIVNYMARKEVKLG